MSSPRTSFWRGAASAVYGAISRFFRFFLGTLLTGTPAAKTKSPVRFANTLPPLRLTYGGDDPDEVDIVIWVRRVVNVALREVWLQDHLMGNTLELLYGVALIMAQAHVRANPRLGGFTAFWSLLRFLMRTFGGPDADIRDNSGRWYASREPIVMSEDAIRQRLAGVEIPPPLTLEMIVQAEREFTPKGKQHWSLSSKQYSNEMEQLVRQLLCHPFTPRKDYL